jgi:hypothetical protein
MPLEAPVIRIEDICYSLLAGGNIDDYLFTYAVSGTSQLTRPARPRPAGSLADLTDIAAGGRGGSAQAVGFTGNTRISLVRASFLSGQCPRPAGT